LWDSVTGSGALLEIFVLYNRLYYNTKISNHTPILYPHRPLSDHTSLSRLAALLLRSGLSGDDALEIGATIRTMRTHAYTK
jgi:hypothetical protein